MKISNKLKSQKNSQNLVQESLIQQQQSAREGKQFSSYLSTYQNDLDNVVIPKTNQLFDELNNSGIMRCSPQWKRDFDIRLLKTDFQSSLIQISIGFYAIEITVMKTFFNLDLFNEQYIGGGGFGKVYKFQKEKKNYVVKAITINQQINLDQNFLIKIYQQYMIATICNILKIGPKILKPFGYDIVIFKNVIVFCMEYCQPISMSNVANQQKQKGLKRSLKILHSLHICHCDLKTQNVLWSGTFQKFVFIDFGLSKFVQNDIGLKTKTQFVGTYNFTSPQMKKLFMLKTFGYVDLYYNDLFGLEKTQEALRLHNNNQPKIRIFQEEDDGTLSEQYFSNPFDSYQRKQVLSNVSFIITLKYWIFSLDIEKLLRNVRNSDKMEKSSIQILQFHILNNTLTQSQFVQISSLLENKTKTLLKNSDKVSSVDAQLCFYFQSFRERSQLFPLNFILNLQKQQFKKLMKNPIWRNKIYMVLNPFTTFKQKKITNFSEKQTKFIYDLIEKIYEDLQMGQLNQTNFFFKARKVISYFHDYLKSQKNLQLLKFAKFLMKHMRQPPAIIQQMNQQILALSRNNPLIFAVQNLFLFMDAQCYQCLVCLPNNKFNYLCECFDICSQHLNVFNEKQTNKEQYNCDYGEKNTVKHFSLLYQISSFLIQLINRLKQKISTTQTLIKLERILDDFIPQQFSLYCRMDVTLIKIKIRELIYLRLSGEILQNKFFVQNESQQLSKNKIQIISNHFYKLRELSIQYQSYYDKKMLAFCLSPYISFSTLIKQVIMKYDQRKNHIYLQSIQYYFQIYKFCLSRLNNQFWCILEHLLQKNIIIACRIVQLYVAVFQNSQYKQLSQMIGEFSHLIPIINKIFQYQLNILTNKNVSQFQIGLVKKSRISLENLGDIFINKIKQNFPSLNKNIISQQQFDLLFIQNKTVNKNQLDIILNKLSFYEKGLLTHAKLYECVVQFYNNNFQNFMENMEHIFQLSSYGTNKYSFLCIDMLISFKKNKKKEISYKIGEYLDLKIIQIIMSRKTGKFHFQSLSLYFKDSVDQVLVLIDLFSQKKMFQLNFQIMLDLIVTAYESKQVMEHHKIIKTFLTAVDLYCSKTNKKHLVKLIYTFYDRYMKGMEQIQNQQYHLTFIFSLIVATQGLIDFIVIKRIFILVANGLRIMSNLCKNKILSNYYRSFTKICIQKDQFYRKSRKRIIFLKHQIRHGQQVKNQLFKLINEVNLINYSNQNLLKIKSIACNKINKMLI